MMCGPVTTQWLSAVLPVAYGSVLLAPLSPASMYEIPTSSCGGGCFIIASINFILLRSLAHPVRAHDDARKPVIPGAKGAHASVALHANDASPFCDGFWSGGESLPHVFGIRHLLLLSVGRSPDKK